MYEVVTCVLKQLSNLLI